jgi:hypothetical protein
MVGLLSQTVETYPRTAKAAGFIWETPANYDKRSRTPIRKLTYEELHALVLRKLSTPACQAGAAHRSSPPNFSKSRSGRFSDDNARLCIGNYLIAGGKDKVVFPLWTFLLGFIVADTTQPGG